MRRLATGLKRSGYSSQDGIWSGRGVSAVPGGMTPSSSWRAWISSRSASQPSSKRPRNFSIHSGQTWCGAWVAPGEKYTKKGLFGAAAFWRRIHSIV